MPLRKAIAAIDQDRAVVTLSPYSDDPDVMGVVRRFLRTRAARKD